MYLGLCILISVRLINMGQTIITHRKRFDGNRNAICSVDINMLRLMNDLFYNRFKLNA